MRGSKATAASFKGREQIFSTSREAYIWLLHKFIAANPDILDNDSQRYRIVEGRGRTYLALNPKELYRASPHLDDPAYFEQVSRGWFATINMNNDVKFNVLCRFASAAHYRYGEDWTWDDGAKRRRPGKPLELSIDDL